MSPEEIRAARDKHMELRYEMKFDRKVWSRGMVRKFGISMKKTFPHYFDCMTPYSVVFIFKNRATKDAIMGRIKIATIPWHNEVSENKTALKTTLKAPKTFNKYDKK